VSKTVKVRIAVAVDPSGEWSATGWHEASDELMMECARDSVADGEALYWLEAELAIPEPETVQASVTEAAP